MKNEVIMQFTFEASMAKCFFVYLWKS